MSPVSRGFRHLHRATDEDAGRVPPGQYATEGFPVLSAGPTPRTPLKKWTCSITQGGQIRKSWTWASRTKNPCDGGVGRAFADSTGAETYMPVSGQESVPSAFEFLNNVILTADRPSWRQLGADHIPDHGPGTLDKAAHVRLRGAERGARHRADRPGR
jgi:hypothetical protein